MIKEVLLSLSPAEAATEEAIAARVAAEMGICRDAITHIRLLRRSLDARQRHIVVNIKVRAYIHEEPADAPYTPIPYRATEEGCPRVVIVGAGPAGLFAALRAIELGLRPIVLERGKDVHERKRDTAAISRHIVNPESNYCFGEGGAGAFSDGKLYTRSKKRGSVERILHIFCQHGASPAILYDAHPHIGTDRLPQVIEQMRATILRCGGEVHFQTKMLRLLIERGACIGCVARNMLSGSEETYLAPAVVLATGHSARDIYRYLFTANIAIESKALAVGVRLEHPRSIIDAIQYHGQHRNNTLPAAEYNYVCQVGGRGVYSFCMCPGGSIIPATTEQEGIVVNGMSAAARAAAWSNSGMVVELRQDDVLEILRSEGRQEQARDYPLLMMDYLATLEHTTWQQGNRRQTAPAQRMTDFVGGTLSSTLPASSYAPGLLSSPLHFWLPAFVGNRLRAAFRLFGQRSRGFLSSQAVVVGTETRTSSPVRILRDEHSLQHIHLRGLFPCGEGAGYAGGIVSSAIDGERVAEAVKAYLATR